MFATQRISATGIVVHLSQFSTIFGHIAVPRK